MQVPISFTPQFGDRFGFSVSAPEVIVPIRYRTNTGGFTHASSTVAAVNGGPAVNVDYIGAAFPIRVCYGKLFIGKNAIYVYLIHIIAFLFDSLDKMRVTYTLSQQIRKQLNLKEALSLKTVTN